MAGTLNTIAQDVKIQLEFNPAIVAEYRLIGYENRLLKREDFDNDKVDAGDIGAGHTVTAMYEITPTNLRQNQRKALRYSAPPPTNKKSASNELAFLKLRYKLPNEKKSQRLQQIIKLSALQTDLSKASDDFRFASAVVGFAQLLRGSETIQDFSLSDVLTLARTAQGEDLYGYRSEFVQIVEIAQGLARPDLVVR